jgi:tetratricopeptide (TPR) repeat protein
MMDNLEYIDRFFKGELSPEEKLKFEQRIEEDPAFAEEVAFYAGALQATKDELAEEKKKKFREIYQQDKHHIITPKPIRKLWPYMAAAAIVVGILIGAFLLFKSSSSPQQLADNYINEKLKTLPVKMGIEEDSIQTGLHLYNEEKYDSALQLFETIIQRDTGNYKAKIYMGIVYLRTGNYDKALAYFRQLENYHSLLSNPAIFYQALTLLKRNQPGDKQKARQFLQQIVNSDNLDGKETAQQWLDKDW